MPSSCSPHEQSLELDDIYRPQGLSGWTSLMRGAGLIVAEPTPEEPYFSERLRSLRHVDDSERLNALRTLSRGDVPDAALARKVELLFVTLDKRSSYHERIAHRDYAIDSDRSHWQTQNGAGPDTPAGRRYLQSDHNGCSFQLFVRETLDVAYAACGPGSLVEAEGNRPMSVVW